MANDGDGTGAGPLAGAVLYDMDKAPNPRRVRFFLAEKGLSIDKRSVDILALEHLTPEYLAINPRGVAPALKLSDGRVIDESIAICRYIEALVPEPNLFGRDAFEIATIEQWQRRVEFDGMLSAATVFRNEGAAFAERTMPGSGPPTRQIPELAERGRVLTAHWFATFDARLADNRFVAGDRFTVADITAFITLDFAKWVKMRLGDEHPHARRWYADVAARPAARA